MSTECARCKQLLVREYRQCSICLHRFHPSCSRIYLSYRIANLCCFKNLSTIMPNELHSRDVTYKQSSSPSSLSVLTSPELSSGSSLLSIETTLNVFINQQTLFNKDLSDAITSIKLQSKNQQDMNIKLNASMKQQIKGQEEITTKLNEIKNLTKTLADHEVRIKKLEQQNNLLSNELSEVLDQNELLAREIEELKVTLSGISSESILSEIIISAIPIQLSDDLQHVVSRVLTSLDSSQLLSDVLDIRKVAPKNDTRTASTSSTAQSTKTSVIVRFKSANIARFLIEKKRRKGSLTLKHVFDSDIRGKVYVNEFLSTKVHNLYRKTKEIVISRKWKYVWVREGKMYVRQNDGSDKICISSDADLDQIIPQQ
ncbi:hypothetical protein PV328_010401 [Microctonus aethiopoides]|uniref:FP protein C-terminal domain-containing protein n=1 Tax=Microctonus aethiopoides TaxID=144406 RepID=A0AA39FI42_9HYME|nr:hypothetical protein PV328_010401 [Microctonus aethiopoides]